jgi:hypothetical protein
LPYLEGAKSCQNVTQTTQKQHCGRPMAAAK